MTDSRRSSELPVVLTIDGPAGAGKSTVALAVARRLGFRMLNSGALYRAVAWLAKKDGVALDDGDALARLARAHLFEFEESDGSGPRLLIDGNDVHDVLFGAAVSEQASAVALQAPLRTELNRMQRRMAQERSTVAEGRDAGTVVFPDALLKVFLTASAEERARRRSREQAEDRPTGSSTTEHLRSGLKTKAPAVVAAAATSATTQRAMAERDQRDSSRSTAPLRVADDAITIATDGLTVDEVVERIVGEFAKVR